MMSARGDDRLFHIAPLADLDYQAYEVVFASETVAARVRYAVWDRDPAGTAAFIGGT